MSVFTEEIDWDGNTQLIDGKEVSIQRVDWEAAYDAHGQKPIFTGSINDLIYPDILSVVFNLRIHLGLAPQ
ncbi:hypothetical protein FRC16_000363 [Serendipita sp. 398]|nr:hypothetical protein FRC16_000363 [Serendipita sp. 398]